MKIIFAGTGSAFTMENYQTNTVIQRNGKNLLIDAGMDIRFSLRDVGMSHKDIDALYITHLHSDHVGGVEWLAFITFFDPSVTKKVKLYGNSDLIYDMWNNTLQGGLASIQARQMHLEDYFDVNPILPNSGFEWEGIQFEIVQSVHIMNKYAIVPSYGLMIKDPDSGLTFYYTGDTQFNPNQIMDFYKQSDVIIQDCETYPFKSGVHANFLDLVTLDEDIKAKMMLTHYQDKILDTEQFGKWKATAEGAGFKCWDGNYCGFITQGNTLDSMDIKKMIEDK